MYLQKSVVIGEKGGERAKRFLGTKSYNFISGDLSSLLKYFISKKPYKQSH